nr:cell division control protein 48 homolog C [Ipomoea batatas]
MKQGRRSGGGGGGLQALRRQIETCRSKYSTVEQIVDHLRSAYPQYGRQKMQPFTKRVQDVLQTINSRGSLIEDSSDDSSDQATPPRKIPRRIDESEKRLQQIEAQHLRNMQRKKQGADEELSSSDSETGSDDSTPTSSSSLDAVYGEKIEPKHDLMRSMLRDQYSEQKAKTTPKSNAKVMEVEVVNNSDANKVKKKVPLLKGKQVLPPSPAVNLGKKGPELGGIGIESNGEKPNAGPKFKDLGGMGSVVEELKMEVMVPLYHPQLLKHLGIRPMSGILFYGPPGCGKTKLAHAIANETGVPFYKISATELVSGISGASEENIRELFSKAYRTAPSIVFIDEIDAIASKRENVQREMERRIVTQLMTCMDESHRNVQHADGNSASERVDGGHGNAMQEGDDGKSSHVLVIGATNRPDSIDPALRRPGRFDREIVLGIPNENARVDILSVLTRNLKVEGAFDLMKIARSTPGFVGADLVALTNKAGNLAMKRIIDQRKTELSEEPVGGEHNEEWWKEPWSPEEMEKVSITMADFEEAVKMVQPSSRREGFSAIPNVKWEDVGGLELLRREFDRYIVRRIKYPEVYEGFGVDLETGFLLYGPPGCGKTLIAKAVANEAGANFIHVKGPELLSKYVGEGEFNIRTLFNRARTCSPCIIFFDEVDALTTERNKEGSYVIERMLNQLLIELDGAEQRKDVYVIGATNRPEAMDRALLRPGRFGKLLYVPLPSPDERGLILKALARKKSIDPSVDLAALGRHDCCKNLSGADLSALMLEAAMAAVDEKLELSSKMSIDGVPTTIKDVHFELARKKITPSVSEEQIEYYKVLSQSFKAA